MRTASLVLFVLAACAGAREEVTPEIAISPGFEARIAVMDRYRLHDEDRRRRMVRPHVWVEEPPAEEDGGTDGGGD